MRKALLGHVSQETAYVIDDYPYGSLRCKRRVWVETKPRHGMRFVAQTTNPKRPGEVWNKPHAETYHEIVVLYLEPQEDGRAFVEFASLDFHLDDAAINRLRLLVGDEALQHVWKKIEVNRKMRDAMNNRFREPERRIATQPLLPFEELVAAQAVEKAA